MELILCFTISGNWQKRFRMINVGRFVADNILLLLVVMMKVLTEKLLLLLLFTINFVANDADHR